MLDPRLKDSVVVASVSGGKDSAAMSLYLTEMGIEHRRVFADTGWESQKTYDYVKGPLEAKLGKIEWVRGERQMEELIVHKGMFAGRMHRFCTEELKLWPIQALIEQLLQVEDDVVNAVGIRRAESAERSAALEWEWAEHFDCWTWRPLVNWTEADVIAIHTRHGLAPNPLYLDGASRVGCWPCVYARKRDVRQIAKTDPDRIEAIRKLEAAVEEAQRLRLAERGETRESLGYWEPTFLLVPIPGTKKRRAARIDEVVAWANTPDPPRWREDPTPPCTKWGLCESEPEGVDEVVDLAVGSEP